MIQIKAHRFTVKIAKELVHCTTQEVDVLVNYHATDDIFTDAQFSGPYMPTTRVDFAQGLLGRLLSKKIADVYVDTLEVLPVRYDMGCA